MDQSKPAALIIGAGIAGIQAALDIGDPQVRNELTAPEETRPDRRYEKNEAKLTLAELTSSLPERQREAYLLHKLDGLSYQEVAEQLGVSLASVESLIHRARVNLSKTIKKKSGKLRK